MQPIIPSPEIPIEPDLERFQIHRDSDYYERDSARSARGFMKTRYNIWPFCLARPLVDAIARKKSISELNFSRLNVLSLFALLASNDDQEKLLSASESPLPMPNPMCSSTERLHCGEIRPSEMETVIPMEHVTGQIFDDDDDDDEQSNLISSDQWQCRICLDIGGDDLIAPCHCRGTQKYVHRSCLDNWRSTKEGFAFAHCTECKATFCLRANVPPQRWWLKLKFRFLVIRDHVLIFIIVQLVVAFFSMLVYKFYGAELREMFGYEQNHVAFYILAAVSIIMVGLLYGFFIAMICGHKITERHYHVLAKQELTKEYVVESREDNKDPPELDSAHVTELRTLGLY